MWKASGKTDFEIVERAWDGDAASQRIFEWAGWDDNPDPEKARQCFFAYDDESPENKTAYKLPFCDIVDGEPVIVSQAVSAVAGALSGARGGVDLPDDVKDAIIRKLNALYERMDKPSPFEKSIKIFEEDGVIKMQGYGVVFGGRDLEGEKFLPTTDFWMDKLPLKNYPVLYDHGMHPYVRHTVIGHAQARKDDVGIWLEIELEKAREYQEYVAMVRGLAEQKVLGISSGALGHLVQRDFASKTILEWPIVEFSLTPTPAEPRTVGVDLVKLFGAEFKSIKDLAEAEEESPAPAGEAGEQSADEPVEEVQTSEYQPDIQPEEGEKKMETTPEYVVENAKHTLGDFLRAVKHRDHESLKSFGAIKDVLESGSGGYLVPSEFVEQIFNVRDTAVGEMLARATVVRNPAGNPVLFPYLDQTTNGMYGGIGVNIIGEGSSITETQPGFGQSSVTMYKLQVSNELLQDSAVALESYLAPQFRNSLVSAAEYYMLKGSGSSQPLGALHSNNTALVTVTRASGGNLIDLADIANLYAAQVNPSNAVWVAHPTVVAQLMQLNAGNVIAWQRDITGPVPAVVYGRPLIISRHASAIGSAGDLSFIDFSQMFVAHRDPSIATSTEFAFNTDLVTWRAILRFGCRPNLGAKIDLGSSNYQSPFVTLGAAS